MCVGSEELIVMNIKQRRQRNNTHLGICCSAYTHQTLKFGARGFTEERLLATAEQILVVPAVIGTAAFRTKQKRIHNDMGCFLLPSFRMK